MIGHDRGPVLDEVDIFVHDAVRAYAIATECPEPPEGDEWVDRARVAGVLSAVVAAARQSGRAAPESLRMLRPSVVARHMRTLQDLSEVGGALTGANIPWAVLKGPVLNAAVFEQPHVRDYTDLDLLVSPSRVRQTVEVLLAARARVLPVDWTTVNAARTAELGLELRNGTVLDLHWSLINLGTRRDGYRLPTDPLLLRRVERTIDGTTVTTLDDRDLVLHVLLHACLSGCTSLRWLLDAQQCVRWLRCSPEELATRACELGLTAPARAVLDSATAHLDPTLAPWADAMGRATVWTRGLAALSRRRPPSSPSATSRTTKTWYEATRPRTRSSVLAAARTAALTLRYWRDGWPEPTPTPFRLDDPGYAKWLAVAEGAAS